MSVKSSIRVKFQGLYCTTGLHHSLREMLQKKAETFQIWSSLGKKRVGQTTDLLLSACFQSVSDLKRENEGLKKEPEQV